MEFHTAVPSSARRKLPTLVAVVCAPACGTALAFGLGEILEAPLSLAVFFAWCLGNLLLVRSSRIKSGKMEAELGESEKRLRELSARLLSLQEEERKRIAREVHDSIGSYVSGVKIGLENFLDRMERGEGRPESLEMLIEMLREAIKECRRVTVELRHPIIDDCGLIAALESMSRRFREFCPEVEVRCTADMDENEIEESLKIVVFRLVQEALSNVRKHGNAREIAISLVARESRMELTIEDDGAGFDVEALGNGSENGSGFGLTSMRERVQLSGGSFSIRSTPGAGTVIRASWAIRPPSARTAPAESL